MAVLTGCRPKDGSRIKASLRMFFMFGCLGGIFMRAHGCLSPDCIRSTCKETDGPFICVCPEHFVLQPDTRTCFREATIVTTTVLPTTPPQPTTESTNQVPSPDPTFVPLQLDNIDVPTSTTSLKPEATTDTTEATPTSLPDLSRTAGRISKESQLHDTNDQTLSISAIVPRNLKIRYETYPSPKSILHLQLQPDRAVISFPTTASPIMSVLSGAIFEREDLPSHHGANKILTSKSNARNTEFDVILQPSVNRDSDLLLSRTRSAAMLWHDGSVRNERRLGKIARSPDVPGHTTLSWMPKSFWDTGATSQIVSSTQSTTFSTAEPRHTYIIKAQTTVPLITVATSSTQLIPDITTRSVTTATYISCKDIPTTSESNKIIPKLNILEGGQSKINLLQKEIPEIKVSRPETRTLHTQVPQTRVLGKEITKSNTEIPNTDTLRTETPITRKQLHKTKISLSPRIESSLNKGSKGKPLLGHKYRNLLLDLVAMIRKQILAKSARHAPEISPFKNLAPSSSGYERSGCQVTGCVNGVCQQVDAGVFKCSCHAGFQPSTNNINTCIRRRYNRDSCSVDRTCRKGRCVRRGGLYVCQCDAGYKYSDWSCVDINECLMESSCRQGYCTNYHGGYTCSCYPGYQLRVNRNGRQCMKRRNPFLGSVGWLWLLMMREGI